MNDYDRKVGSKKKAAVILAAIGVVLFLVGMFFIHVHNVRSENDAKITSSMSKSAATPEPSPSPSANGHADNDTEADTTMEKYDWSKLKGQKLSNAYKTVEHDGISITDLDITVLTNDGKQVFNAANWSITDISFSKPNKVLIHANHDSSNGVNDKGTGTIGSIINNTLDKL